jgi:hypothetical protein
MAKRLFFVSMIMIVAGYLYSCKNEVSSEKDKLTRTENNILQQEDGSISLKVDKADCYSDMSNPSSNTAEWNVFIKKSGRFDVWLSSATKDTTNLAYKNSVKLSIHDKRLEAIPGCDKVFHNSGDVAYPYFRADSFMGSLYIQDTGHYNIQIISEKILPKGFTDTGTQVAENSKLLSVFLTPITQ